MEDKDYNNIQVDKSDIVTILHTAARTAFVMFVAIALSVVAMFSFFPELPQKLYYGADYNVQALRYARMRAAKLENGVNQKAYCSSLSDVITITEQLCNDKGYEKYGAILYDYTLKLSSVPTVDEYDRSVDEFNYQNSSSGLRAVVYSNECYIKKLNYISALNMGNTDAFLTRNGLQKLKDAIPVEAVDSYEEAMEFSFLMIQLNELFKTDIIIDSDDDNIERLAEAFSKYKEFALSYDDAEAALKNDALLAKLYFVRVGGIFSHSASVKFGNEEWNSLDTVRYNDENMQLIAYYRDVLLKQYLLQKTIN